MNQFHPSESESGPGQLADYLAELLKRFRHFSGPMEPVPAMASDLARIKISARLLVALKQIQDPATEGFVRLGGVLCEWVTFFESSPEFFPCHLSFPVERLADFLEQLLVSGDRGVPAGELARDKGWGSVLGAFRQAGTPLAVMEEVEDLFRNWKGRWTDENLTPVQERQLSRRWLSLKKAGDVLFSLHGRPGTAAENLRGSAQGSSEILLLVDSKFRRDQIRDKLSDRDFRVEVPCDPDQALEFLAGGPVPRAILCDNLEPTRHLVMLREGMSSLPEAENIPLILVVGSSLAASADEERARSLGAVASWRDPFDPMDLKRILQRLGGP